MRRISNFLLVGIMLLTSIPMFVHADSVLKEVNGRVFLIEQMENGPSGVTPSSKIITYEWGSDNKIYKIESDHYYYALVKTTDEEVVSDKTYYDIHGDEIETPIDDDLDDYYEFKYFVLNKSEVLDAETDYYTVDDLPVKIATLVEIPEASEALNYYVIDNEEDIFTKTYIMTVDFNNFNKTPIEGKTLTKEMFKSIIKIENTNYLYFQTDVSENGGVGFLYNTDGQPVKSGNEIILINDYIHSLLGRGIIYLEGEEGENELNIKMLDSNFELIQNIEITAGGLAKIETTDNYEVFRYFNDDNGELEYLKVTLYELEEGSNQTYNDNNLTFKFSGQLDKLSNVLINGTELDSDNYIAEDGSTIITLDKDYLKTLSVGTYTLKLEYTDGGYVSTTFRVGEENPQTFDGIMIYVILGAISLIGGSLITIYNKKKRLN